MNLLEHEAKKILQSAGIPVPQSRLFQINNLAPQHPELPEFSPSTPIVLKSQVPIGGRGKAGGIIIVDTAPELLPAFIALRDLEIKGHKPKSILAEEKLAIKRELYLSLLVDRASASLKLIAHTNGGVEVEDNKEFASWELDYSKPDFDSLGQALADYYDLQDQVFMLQEIIQNLHTALKKNDALLIEINPFILTQQNTLIAGDAKITLDDAATFRHPDWDFEYKANETNFVTINEEGNIATIANGAGLAMATVDAVHSAGLIPANFLDVGGGATTETLLAAFERIVEYPNVQAIIINIFAGITRSDEIAKAIIAANKEMKNLPPLFIRIAGTNYKEAASLLKIENIAILPDLQSCLKAAKRVIHA